MFSCFNELFSWDSDVPRTRKWLLLPTGGAIYTKCDVVAEVTSWGLKLHLTEKELALFRLKG